MRKMKKGLSILLAAMLLLGMLAACATNDEGFSSAAGSSSSSKVSETSVETGAEESSGTGDASGDVQELNLRAKAFGNNYDVQDMGWRWMMAACYEGLYRNLADENGDTFELAGAESVDISDDGLTYTFHLREDAKWSDGVAVTAKDYEYGWKRLLDPQYGYHYSAFIFNVAGAKDYYDGKGGIDDVAIAAVDDYTFEVKLVLPDPSFTYKLVATPLYPTREDLATAAGDNWGKDWTLCVYNGPYAMSELLEDNKMVWTKNEHYWNADNVRLEKINWFAISEDATAATMFENGQLDVFDASGDYIAKYNQDVEAGKYYSLETDYPGTVLLSFEFEKGGTSGLMQNVKIRKALAYAMNKEEMVDAVYGRYTPAYGLVSPAITVDGKSYTSEPVKAEYDEYVGNTEKLQELFKEGLAELGDTREPQDITITFLSYGSATEDQTEREYIQQSIEQNLDCKVELNTVGDYNMYKAEYEAFNFDLLDSGWWSDYNDPQDFFHIFQTGIYDTYGLYSNVEYDALLDTLNGEEDIDTRMEIFGQLEQMLLVDDCACIPIYYSDKHYFIQNWVKDFHTSSFGASQDPVMTYIEGKNA